MTKLIAQVYFNNSIDSDSNPEILMLKNNKAAALYLQEMTSNALTAVQLHKEAPTETEPGWYYWLTFTEKVLTEIEDYDPETPLYGQIDRYLEPQIPGGVATGYIKKLDIVD